MTDSTFLSPAHEQVYTEFVTSVTCRSELVHAVFDTMAARDHYLELLVAQLLQYPLDILEIGPETDILTLFNPRLTDIPLATATQKVTQGTTSGVLLVRDAEAIAATTWSVLFALLRDARLREPNVPEVPEKRAASFSSSRRICSCAFTSCWNRDLIKVPCASVDFTA
jgi:hypothetical protein